LQWHGPKQSSALLRGLSSRMQLQHLQPGLWQRLAAWQAPHSAVNFYPGVRAVHITQLAFLATWALCAQRCGRAPGLRRALLPVLNQAVNPGSGP